MLSLRARCQQLHRHNNFIDVFTFHCLDLCKINISQAVSVSRSFGQQLEVGGSCVIHTSASLCV